jgi:hypothetical protein
VFCPNNNNVFAFARSRETVSHKHNILLLYSFLQFLRLTSAKVVIMVGNVVAEFVAKAAKLCLQRSDQSSRRR